MKVLVTPEEVDMRFIPRRKNPLYLSVTFCLFALFILCTPAADAGNSQVFVLSDGSVIQGEILSLNEGVYTIKTDTLGTIEIEASKIKAIQSQHIQSINNEEFQRLQQQIMRNPEVMSMILALQDDPEIQEVLQDPVIMNAINSGDIESLLSNQKILNLLNHPKVQDIGKKVLK